MGEQGSWVVAAAAYGEDDLGAVGINGLGQSFADPVEILPGDGVNPLSISVVIRFLRHLTFQKAGRKNNTLWYSGFCLRARKPLAKKDYNLIS